MKIKKIVMAIVIAIILNSCATSFIVPTKTAIPTPTITSTPYPKRDAIYFWWYENSISQLWKIAQNGDSAMLYELPALQTLDEALNAGLLTENGAETLRQFSDSDPNSQKSELNETIIQSLPDSLQLSPDRLRIAWHEKVSYCTWFSDISYCVGETIVHVLNLENQKMEIALVIPIGQEFLFPLMWSPNSEKLAYHTRQNDSGETKNTIHILDIDSAQTITIDGSGEFVWTPDSNNIIFSNTGGIHLLALTDKESRQILDGNWWISDLGISLDGNSLIFTGIKDFDDPATSYFDDHIDPDHQFIYAFNLKTNIVQPILNENKRDWIQNLQWLPDGKNVIYTQKEPYAAPPNQVIIRNATTGESVLIESIPLDVDNDWQISQDGEKILFIGSKYDETISLIIYDINKGEWNKVSVPAKIQVAMDKNLKEGEQINHRLWAATW